MSLNQQRTIRTALFVRIPLEQYWNGSSFVQETLTFSDNSFDVVIGGETYTGIGNFLQITGSSKELRANSNSLSLTISGIPNSSIEKILKSRIKSAPIEIVRIYFNADGSVIAPTDDFPNPTGRYRGFINNYVANEEWNSIERTSNITVQFECKSWVDLLSKKTAGRKTNDVSMKQYFPNDRSFERVWALAYSNYDFGKLPR